MINNILYGVTRAIKTYFGPEYEVHVDFTSQLKPGRHFLVEEVHPIQKQWRNNIYNRQVRFAVHYINNLPNHEEFRTEAREVAEGLFKCLDRIEVKYINPTESFLRAIYGYLNGTTKGGYPIPVLPGQNATESEIEAWNQREDYFWIKTDKKDQYIKPLKAMETNYVVGEDDSMTFEVLYKPRIIYPVIPAEPMFGQDLMLFYKGGTDD